MCIRDRHTATPSGWGYGKALFPCLSKRMMKRCWRDVYKRQVAGFFCYPLDTLREEEGSQKIFDFRDKLEEVFTTDEGSEVLTLTGGATGRYCGYVDFIAWDIQEALNMAKEFFEGTDIPWAILDRKSVV